MAIDIAGDSRPQGNAPDIGGPRGKEHESSNKAAMAIDIDGDSRPLGNAPDIGADEAK